MVMINDISFERRFVSLMIRGCQDSRQESYYFNNGLFSSLKFESDKDMLLFGSNHLLFAFRTCLPNRVMCTPSVSTLLHQTPSIRILLPRKKKTRYKECFEPVTARGV